MNKDQFIKDMQEALKESVDYFSPQRKDERELWVGLSFIENFGIAFDSEEVIVPFEDPPDVTFRDANFEIKEILDPGRKRHKEFKERYKKSLSALEPEDFLEDYAPIEITPVEISELILNSMDKFSEKYDRKIRSSLDLLIYVNLKRHLLVPGEFPVKELFSYFGWRSISALMGWGNLVFFTNKTAPMFLQNKEAILTIKKFPE